MRVQILCDSYCDFTAAERLSPTFQKVPAAVILAGQRFVDDDGFQQAPMLPLLSEKDAAPRVEFPDEQVYLAAMRPDADEIYVVTSSAANVGQYEKAFLARKLRLQDQPDQRIHVFNTRGGSVAQLLAARRIRQMQRSGCDFRQIVERVEKDLLSDRLYLLPADAERLRRLALLAPSKRPALPSVLCGKTMEGGLTILTSAMTDRGAEKKLLRLLAKQHRTGGLCVIAHCGGLERARRLMQALRKSGCFTEFLLAETGAVTSAALGPGGVALAFSP